MPWLDNSPLEYQVNTANSLRRFQDDRAPTNADYKQFRLGDLWNDTSSNDWWILCYRDSTQGIWRKVGGTSAAVEFFTPDSGGQTGPDAVNNMDLLGDSVGYLNGIHFFGDPANNTLSARDLRNITKYVVDPTALETEYQTIQAALDAANAAGTAAAVYIRPGTYTENLTLYDGIDLWGAVGVADTQTCVIQGVHTPPASGTLTVRNIFLQSATDIFNSAVAGTTELILIDCAVNVTNGYTFNLPNWTGGIAGFDIGEIGSTNDGWINNTGGSYIFMTNITMGAGAVNTCIISGSSEFYNVHVQCPITYQSTGTTVISGGCWFDRTVTTANTATVGVYNSLFDTGALQAITHNSASTLILSTVSVNSTNVPAIGGTGTIDITGLDLIGDQTFAGTLTLVGGKSVSETARLLARTANTVAYYSAGGELDELGAMLNGQLIIGSTGATPGIANLASAGGTIAITNGAGTINLETGGGIATQYTAEDATTCAPALGNLNIVGTATNGINTTAAGSTMTIGMASPYSDGDFTFTTATAAATRTLTVSNTDNTAASYSAAQLNLSVGGTTTIGDPFVHWQITGSTEYSFGIDNTSTTDLLKLTTGANPSTGTEFLSIGNNTIKDFVGIFTSIGPANIQDPSVTVVDTIIGGNVGIATTNLDATNTSSNSIFSAIVGGAGSGDPCINTAIAAGQAYSMGLDNSSTGDLWRLTGGSTPSATPIFMTLGNNGVKDFIGFLDETTGPAAITDPTFSIIDATAAGLVGLYIGNTDNTSGTSNAAVDIQVGGTSAGDPYIHWEVSGTTEYSFGIDNTSTTDLLRMTDGADPSTGNQYILLGDNGVKRFVSVLSCPTGPGAITSNSFCCYDTLVAGNVGIGTHNNDNTNTASDAGFSAQVGGTSAGDPFIIFSAVGSAATRVIGYDNSDSDKMKITYAGTTPSTGTEQWVMTTAGERTMPLQPAFLAYNSTTDNNQTGNGTTATVEFDTEVYDQNADYDNATDTFTAPVTGKYLLETNVIMSNLAAATGGNITIVTSNRTYYSGPLGWNAIKNSGNYARCFMSAIADMDAADTAYVQITITGEAADTVGVYGVASPQTYFCGSLLC